jgi:ATP-dependent exoDNAse (exonuclease V) beta subunit
LRKSGVETPLQHYRDDGTLIEGVVDFAFQDDGSDFSGWTVVDFKTDREIENAENQYRAQVAAYVQAVRIATACPTRGFLFVVYCERQAAATMDMARPP